MALTSTHEAPLFSYFLMPWGDLIYGTKEELQALGLGQGTAFPGEIGGPRRRLKSIDPRGFPCMIERAEHHGAQQFSASISIPGRERPSSVIEEYAPGVTVVRLWWSDLYCGASDALMAAGLVGAARLPGAPGMGKTVTKFFADGAPMPVRRSLASGGPGSMSIHRDSRKLLVHVVVDDAEAEQRREAGIAQGRDHERRLAALPRPAPLIALDRAAAAMARRAQMRLV